MVFKDFILVVLLIFSICNDNFVTSDSACDATWVSFKDEWCYKILDETFRHFEEAQSSCQKLDSSSSLPLIKTKEEQDFLSNYLFKTSKKVENFWIGAKLSNGSSTYQWLDHTDVTFTNWDVKGPHRKTNYCVQMKYEEEVAGKWTDEPCDTKKNLVVCQKIQTWTLARLQKTLLEARKELRDANEVASTNVQKLDEKHLATEKALTDSLSDAKSHIKTLEQNPVPIGFIYVQLYSQPAPSSIWPALEWSQVTSDYAGLFFRAEGGGSTSFGSTQEDDSPKLTNVAAEFLHQDQFSDSISVTPGGWTSYVRSGGPGGGGDHNVLRFYTSGVEVRPRNQAVRIWKRTA